MAPTKKSAPLYSKRLLPSSEVTATLLAIGGSTVSTSSLQTLVAGSLNAYTITDSTIVSFSVLLSDAHEIQVNMFFLLDRIARPLDFKQLPQRILRISLLVLQTLGTMYCSGAPLQVQHVGWLQVVYGKSTAMGIQTEEFRRITSYYSKTPYRV